MSLPPIDAIFAIGSERVGNWLAEIGWERDEPNNSNLEARVPLVGEYGRCWQRQCPIFGFMGEVYATLGGWNMPWPEGGFMDLVNKPLLLWTYRDSEPWVELWRENDQLRVIERIT